MSNPSCLLASFAHRGAQGGVFPCDCLHCRLQGIPRDLEGFAKVISHRKYFSEGNFESLYYQRDRSSCVSITQQLGLSCAGDLFKITLKTKTTSARRQLKLYNVKIANWLLFENLFDVQTDVLLFRRAFEHILSISCDAHSSLISTFSSHIVVNKLPFCLKGPTNQCLHKTPQTQFSAQRRFIFPIEKKGRE